MSSDSFLKSYSHDGGSALASSGLLNKERGLLERMDALLAGQDPQGADKGFIARVTGQSVRLLKGSPSKEARDAVYAAVEQDCVSCASAPDLTPNDNALVDLDQRINGLWGGGAGTVDGSKAAGSCGTGGSCPGH